MPEIVGNHLLATQKELKKQTTKDSMAGRTNSTSCSIKASMAASSNFTRSNKSSDASLQSGIENSQN